MALLGDPVTEGETLANTIAGIVGKFIPDPAAKAQATQQLLQTLQASDASQNEVNKQEAASTSLFVAGWRPAVGWICASALAYQYVIVPVSLWASYAVGHPFPKPPTLDDTLWQLMFGMLGMGGLRTFEKLQGVAGNH